jgi:hypothetical protein
MKQRLIIVLLGIILIVTMGLTMTGRKGMPLQANVFEMAEEIEDAGLDLNRWNNLTDEIESIPTIPFGPIKKSLFHTQSIVQEIHLLRESLITTFHEDPLLTSNVLELFDHVNEIDKRLGKIDSNLKWIPMFLLDETQKEELNTLKSYLDMASTILDDVQKFERILKSFARNEDRLLILLQNQNEPRSTGGFVGSLIVIDFDEELVTWKFEDIYALDRRVPGEDQPLAPEFFHDLSKTISLRDANFWPDFAETSNAYRKFFKSIDEPKPTAIVAVNMNIIEEFLKLSGPVRLPKWDVTVNQYNADLVLQFLVESKIAGRFNAKAPVVEFAEELFRPSSLKNIDFEEILVFDFASFVNGKNILANSTNISLQKLFEKWSIDGRVREKREADNFLYFDFISVGANKSEKFVWTKLWHDSEIMKDGTIKNSIEITRNHALRPGEISELLQENTWSENIRGLMNDDLLWKLGAGQNRTVLRLYVPREAKLIASRNPSGKVNETLSDDKKFKIWEIPMFVNAGEKLKIKIQYKTELSRGSANWRPYFLQLVGTSGREKTTFLETISTQEGGKFTAETKNLGHPEPLIDQDYRAVVEFGK